MIKFYTFLLVIFVFFSAKLVAEEKTLIPQTEVSKTQNIKFDDMSWQDEISRLTLEVEDLKDQVMQQDQESKSLKEELESYRKKEDQDNTRSIRIERLKRILSQPVFSVEDIEDKDIEFSYSAILLNNLDQAKKSLQAFLEKDIKNNPHYYKEIDVEVVEKKELIKDPLNISGQRENSSFSKDLESTHNNKAIDKKEKVIDEEFVANYQKTVDKTNYLLGEIYLIDIQPKESVPYLVEAYNKSKDPDIIVLSLIGITESFAILKKYPEVCVSVQRIERTLEKIKQIDADYVLSPSDESFIERMKETANCKISE